MLGHKKRDKGKQEASYILVEYLILPPSELITKTKPQFQSATYCSFYRLLSNVVIQNLEGQALCSHKTQNLKCGITESNYTTKQMLEKLD